MPFRLSDEDGAEALQKCRGRVLTDLAGQSMQSLLSSLRFPGISYSGSWHDTSVDVPFFGHTVNFIGLFTRKSRKAFQLRAPVFELALVFYFRSKYGSTQLAVNPGSVGRPFLCKL